MTEQNKHGTSPDGPENGNGQPADNPGAAEGHGAPVGPSKLQNWKMFDRIARRYDLLNHLLSANIDRRWRRLLVGRLPERGRLDVLDLASGTGDQLIALLDDPRVDSGVGIDLAEKMLEIGRVKLQRRGLDDRAALQAGDAMAIPFENESFDTVSISFGIRNMTDIKKALAEMHRVLRPGGRALILEFSIPTSGLIRRPYLFYLRHILPRLGTAISGDSGAYRYLNETIEHFPCGDAFTNFMLAAGFKYVDHTPLQFGIATLYQGDKA